MSKRPVQAVDGVISPRCRGYRKDAAVRHRREGSCKLLMCVPSDVLAHIMHLAVGFRWYYTIERNFQLPLDEVLHSISWDIARVWFGCKKLHDIRMSHMIRSVSTAFMQICPDRLVVPPAVNEHRVYYKNCFLRPYTPACQHQLRALSLELIESYRQRYPRVQEVQIMWAAVLNPRRRYKSSCIKTDGLTGPDCMFCVSTTCD